MTDMRKQIKMAIAALALVAAMGGNLSAKGAKNNGTTFAVVVDEKTYEKIPQQVDAYVAATGNSYRKGVLVVDKWFNPDSIKAHLYNMYKTCNLEGAVFIGDIPIPMLRDAQHFTTAFKMNQKMDIKDSSVPSDRFYDDFDLKFKFIRQDDEKKLFFYYSLLPDGAQELGCDIYTARIKAPEGENKYELIAAYLEKAVAAHGNRIAMDKILHFGGHGYNSESMNARIDEAVAFSEQFQFLNTNKGNLEYIDFTFDKYVKTRLMAAVADKDLDLAMLHHHGADDTQYLNGSPFVADPQGWIKLARNYFRTKMRSAKDKEKTRARFIEQYDIPASWCDDAFTPEREKEDSKLDKMVGIFYKPEYKVHIFKGDEMYNEEFLAALDNSPTYSRTAKDLERIISILGNETVVTASVDVTTIDEVENSNIIEENGCDEEDDENVGRPVFYNG